MPALLCFTGSEAQMRPFSPFRCLRLDYLQTSSSPSPLGEILNHLCKISDVWASLNLHHFSGNPGRTRRPQGGAGWVLQPCHWEAPLPPA